MVDLVIAMKGSHMSGIVRVLQVLLKGTEQIMNLGLSKFVKRGQRGNSSYQPFRRDISNCWRYNRGRYCWGCSRPHICTRCRADHPRRDCPLVQARGTKNRSPSPKRTPVKAKILENMLINSGYDELETQFLVEGFTFGFHLNCSASPLPGSCQNLHSARLHKEILQNKLEKELKASRIAGPFSEPLFQI